MKSSLESLNLISFSKASLKLLRKSSRDSELLLKLFKSSPLTFKTDSHRSLWFFNNFRRPFLNSFCIFRLRFTNLHFFLHISIASIWLLSGLVAHFSALASACPPFSKERYWSTDIQVRQGSYIFNIIYCHASGRCRAFTNKLRNFHYNVERQSTFF